MRAGAGFKVALSVFVAGEAAWLMTQPFFDLASFIAGVAGGWLALQLLTGGE